MDRSSLTDINRRMAGMGIRLNQLRNVPGACVVLWLRTDWSLFGVSHEQPSAVNQQRDRNTPRQELSKASDRTKWKRSLAEFEWSKFRHR
jgi:hypothetical protein